MRKIALALLLATIASPAFAEPVTAGQFLARAEPLMKKSKAALVFSGEARKLMRTLSDAAEASRAKVDADRAAGRKPSACLPPKGKASINFNELLAYLRTLPAAERAKSFDLAFTGLMARKYPCPA